MSNIIPVVFCFDKRIILGASVAIKSLMDCAKSSTTYDIRIFHSDLDIENQKNLTSLAQNTRHNIAFHYIDSKLFKNAPVNKGSWTELVYYRLLVSNLIKEYDKVIYSDVDVLFKDDLEELYNTNLENHSWAGVRAEKNTYPTVGHKYFKDNKNEYIYWSGLMLINCKIWQKTNLLDKLFKNIEKYKKELVFFDLDLLNITCNDIKKLPLKYCLLQSLLTDDFQNSTDWKYLQKVYTINDIKEAKKNPAIVHYAGKIGKPWRMKKPYEDYQEYIDNLPKELRKYTFRDLRKRIFNKR